MPRISDDPRLKDWRITLTKRREQIVYELLGPISTVITNVTIEEDIDSPMVEMTFNMRMTSVENFIENGDLVNVYLPKLKFNGDVVVEHTHFMFVLDLAFDTERLNITVTCRNLGHWLMRDRSVIEIKNAETSTEFIRRTANNFNVPIFNLADTQYKQFPKVLQGVNLYDIWVSSLTTTMINEKKNYYLSVVPRGIQLEQILPLNEVWFFEGWKQSSNIMNHRRHVTIMDPNFVNLVRGFEPPNQSNDIIAQIRKLTINAVVKLNQSSIDAYGVFARDIDVTRFANDAELEAEMNFMLSNSVPKDEIRFTTYAINSIRPIDRIFVYDPRAGVHGKYFIKHITTTFNGDRYNHVVRAVKKDEIPANIIQEALEDQEGIFADLAAAQAFADE